MPIKFLDDNNPDGVVFGQTATSKVAFFGASPVVQVATFSSVSTTAAISVAGSACFGFASSDQAIGIVSAVNSVRAALRTLGLVA